MHGSPSNSYRIGLLLEHVLDALRRLVRLGSKKKTYRVTLGRKKTKRSTATASTYQAEDGL